MLYQDKDWFKWYFLGTALAIGISGGILIGHVRMYSKVVDDAITANIQSRIQS